MTTLAEYKYLGAAQEVRMGVGLTLVEVSPWLRDLPFVELTSNNVSRYKMETSDGGASVHDVDDGWSTLNPTWEFREASLAILGDNIQVDEFGELSSGPESAMAVAIMLKAKGIGQTYDKLAVYGQTTSTGSLADSKNFKGLLRLIAETESSTTTDLDGWLFSGDSTSANNKQVLMAASGASAALTIKMVRALVDAVRPFPTHLIMSRLTRQKLETLAEAAGNNLIVREEKLGQIVTMFGEQKVVIDDQIKNNMDDSTALVTAIASYNYEQAIAGGSDTSPIFAARFAEDGLCGINGVGMTQIQDLGILQGADAKGKRLKFYCGMRLTNKRAAAVLMNVNPSS
tara:strand:- start:10804 stop:11832 length:1029 start_codon:yes stop_codon:yes gene_type:complete